MHSLKSTFEHIKPIIKESIETAPEYGYCAAQNSHYFGYKFHGVCSLNGVITSFDLSKANHADIQYLRDIEPYYANCLMLGDKAYLDSEYQLELFETTCLPSGGEVFS